MGRPSDGAFAKEDMIVGLIIDLTLARKKRRWSQDYVAEQLGVTRQAVQRWESFTSAPSLYCFARWAALLDKNLGWLW